MMMMIGISRDKQAKSHNYKSYTWTRKGNLKRETEFLLIAAETTP